MTENTLSIVILAAAILGTGLILAWYVDKNGSWIVNGVVQTK